MSKKVQVKKFGDEYFYKGWDILDEDNKLGLLKNSKDMFEFYKKDESDEVFPPEATYGILDNLILLEYPFVEIYLKEVQKHIYQYAKIKNIDFNSIKPHSGWITRVVDYGDTSHYKLFNPLKNLHSHTNIDIGVVYYLQNPDKKYGTLIKLDEKDVYFNEGQENTLMIYNPQLYHSPIYPSKEDLLISPRYTIVMDFIIEEY